MQCVSKHPRHHASRAELLAIIARQEQIIAELAAQNRALQARVEALEAELARLKKTSATSSKPPSSDLVKPPKPPPPEGQPKRRQGAQPGHPRHLRGLALAPTITVTHLHTRRYCPHCGGAGTPRPDRARLVQQFELVAHPVCGAQHCGMAYWCETCGRWYFAPLPPEVEQGGLLGPRLTALAAYLKGSCHASITTVQQYLGDVLGLSVCRGLVAKAVQKVSRALETPYTQLRAALPQEAHLNVDETGHKDNGKRYWTWCFRAPRFTVFAIAPSRGSAVLRAVLGEAYGGVLGCDYFSAYRKYRKDAPGWVQFCLAHLIRELRFLVTLPGKTHRATRAYAQVLLEDLRGLFHLLHRQEQRTPKALRRALRRVQRTFLDHAIRGAPATGPAHTLAQRFREHGEAYFRFVTEPEVEPTNNRAEQAIRFVVLDRQVTQGTRSQGGQRWCERIWSVRATCAAQDRSVYQYLCEAVQAHFRGQPVPSLLPTTP